jgi:hypothetical protein
MRLRQSESIMRRIFLTLAVTAAVLIAGALVPDRSVAPSQTPFAVPENANLV